MRNGTKEDVFIREINNNGKIIHKICNYYTNTPTEKEDLYQEIIYRLWKSFDKFRNESKLSTWIYRVALNTAITNLSKNKNSSTALSNQEFNIPDSGSQTKNMEAKELLHKALNYLTNNEKAIILLYLDELSYEEIADIIGISKNHVGVKINRIKSRLETIISQI